jgi:hypothetical protein
VGAIRYVVEAVPRSEYLQIAFSLNVIPNLLKRICGVQAVSPVHEIARPICSLSPAAQANTGEIARFETSTARSLKKVLLFMAGSLCLSNALPQ